MYRIPKSEIEIRSQGEIGSEVWPQCSLLYALNLKVGNLKQNPFRKEEFILQMVENHVLHALNETSMLLIELQQLIPLEAASRIIKFLCMEYLASRGLLTCY